MGEYTPSTVPGCRAPHFVLADGTSVYDQFTAGYTAIATPGADTEALVATAAERGIPFRVIEVEPSLLPEAYTQPITIVRQDQQVAWRGVGADAAEAAELWELLRGARVAVSA